MSSVTSASVGAAMVARRCVQDGDGSIDGFELRFGSAGRAGQTPLITATLLDVFSRFASADLFGGRPGLVNLTRAFLVGRLPVPVSPEAATLLITPDIQPDDELLAGAAQLAGSGYRLAVEVTEPAAELAPLLRLAELAVVDVSARDRADVLGTAQRLAAHDVRLMATGIRTRADWDRCQDAGFELFQGGWLDRDPTLDIETIGPDQAIALDLVGRLSSPESSMGEIENLVRHTPELAFRLLRMANSASSGGQRELGSLHDAIVLVGTSRLRSWTLLLSLSSSPAAANALLDALTRAATCERLARATGVAGPESAFTVGLLDGLGEALGVGPAQLLRRLPALADELAETLLGRPGPLRATLERVAGYQRGRLADDELTPELVLAYLEALAWTTQTTSVNAD